MGPVNRRDDHELRLLLLDHLVEVFRSVRRHAFASKPFDAVVGGVHARLVDVADAHQRGFVLEVLDDRLVVEGGAHAGADHDVFLDCRHAAGSRCFLE